MTGRQSTPPISEFLRKLGFPLRNVRNSWGAMTSEGVLLVAWADEERFGWVRVLRLRDSPPRVDSVGRRERIDHLRLLWSGGLAGYAVIAQAVDPAAHTRAIHHYDAATVRSIVCLAEVEGDVWAQLGEAVPVERLHRHAGRHRLKTGQGDFPLAPLVPTAPVPVKAPARYLAAIPRMRERLIALAQQGVTCTYAQARAPDGLRTFELRHAMDRLGNQCRDAGEPILTSLIVNDTGRTSPGFEKEFGVDDIAERAACYAYWGEMPAAQVPEATALRERARQFAQVAIRPEQRAFRNRVFVACGGRCVVTGCAAMPALEAAHRRGRRWQDGHNGAHDGWLLRRDVHALYDKGLITLSDDGARVEVDPSVANDYQDLAR
ncbi:HNH endonuclease signature motif containing protein [Xanthomonas arboricola]|uniref:HNH nuclease domain-containing protein n=1 Tax=Xanthomonas arboricola TaxID=56448 RepID=A0A2S7ADT2_9XANT|nr:HNH endonuclease signature motif containing protein [Xanthomonas arboricola]PPU07892.1 hypothetical protein XarjCFBP7645_09905 [Xanthomonas arboricola]